MTQKTNDVHRISFAEHIALQFVGFYKKTKNSKKELKKNNLLLTFQLEIKSDCTTPLPKF